MKGERRGGGREGKWMEADNDFEASFLQTAATLMPSGINYWKLELSLQFPSAYEYKRSSMRRR